MAASSNQSHRENENDRVRRLLLILLFLLLSLSCIFCSAQLAVWNIDRSQIEASMLPAEQIESGPESLVLAPLNPEIITEAIRDEATLAQAQTPVASGLVVELMPPLPTATARPTMPMPTPLSPTPTPTPTPLADTPDEETEPPATAEPEPSPVPAGPTEPPPPTLPPPTSPPSPTTAPPTLPPSPTPAPPSPTPIPPTPIPTATDAPPPPTTEPTTPPNQPPILANDNATTPEDTAVIIDPLANDNDPDGTLDPTTLTIITGPANGTVTVDPATGLITYTPNPNFNGTDTFTYRVCDNNGDCDTAIITVVVNPVNDPPVAVDDDANINESQPVTLTVLLNDYDPDGDALAVIATGPALSGTVVINPDYTVTYSPTHSQTYGTDTFTYTISDGQLEDTATVTVTIDPVNDPPLARDDTALTAQNTAETIYVLDNDSDPDNDPLTIISVTGPANGTVINHGTSLTYQPNPGFYGFDSFSYTISDGVLTSTAIVSITVISAS